MISKNLPQQNNQPFTSLRLQTQINHPTFPWIEMTLLVNPTDFLPNHKPITRAASQNIKAQSSNQNK